jgi:hypothetical protein
MTNETAKATEPQRDDLADKATAAAKQEARFWKLKYFELQQHTNQVIAALVQPELSGALQDQLAALGYRQQNGRQS